MKQDEAELLIRLLNLYFSDVRIYYGTSPVSVFIIAHERPFEVFISLWSNRVVVRRLLFEFKGVRPIRKRRRDMIFIEPEGELLEDECWTKMEFELTTASETFKEIIKALQVI